MDIILIISAFFCGFIVSRFGLSPLIGYLLCGFLLNYLGLDAPESLDVFSDFGITMMLFLIGVKIQVRQLLKPEVWCGALSHGLLFMVLTASLFFALSYLGLPLLTDMDFESALFMGFALSFSSTVIVVKILEEHGEMKSRHGQIALGILVIQDVIAVAFLTGASAGGFSPMALSLCLLPLSRPLLSWVLKRCGHGELLPLCGIFLAVGAGSLFELLGLKAGLGALVAGMVVSGTDKAQELGRSLMTFKDIFLIGFFLSIGYAALPDLTMILSAATLLLLLPVKAALFLGVFYLLRLRVRTTFLTTLSLTNFSEFCLIVSSAAVASGFLAKEWLVIMALSVAMSFVLSTLLNRRSHLLFTMWKKKLDFMETKTLLAEDVFDKPQGAKILIIGMGRVGVGAYDASLEIYGDKVWGVDANESKVFLHRRENRQVIRGDAEDADFWSHLDLDEVYLIILAVPSLQDALNILDQLHDAGYQGKISALAKYDDEQLELKGRGVDVVFNLYAKAGSGLVSETFAQLQKT